eukprot:gene19755-biopygen11547
MRTAPGARKVEPDDTDELREQSSFPTTVSGTLKTHSWRKSWRERNKLATLQVEIPTVELELILHPPLTEGTEYILVKTTPRVITPPFVWAAGNECSFLSPPLAFSEVGGNSGGDWGGAGTAPPAPCRGGKAEENYPIAAPQAPQGGKWGKYGKNCGAAGAA